MRRFAIALCVGAAFATGCGGQVEEAAQALKNVQSIAQSADNAANAQDALAKRRAERVANGDTLSMAPDALLAYLPTSIDGYTATGEPEKTKMDQTGFSFTTVKRSFSKSDGSTLTCSIADYNGAVGILQGLSAAYMIKISVENGTEKSSTFQLPDSISAGQESFNKGSKTAQANYALVGRFLIQIEASNQTSSDFVKSIAEKIDQKGLASK